MNQLKTFFKALSHGNRGIIKNLLIHHQVIVPITNGALDFGPWQQIFYAEFDGQRPKRLVIKAMGE